MSPPAPPRRAIAANHSKAKWGDTTAGTAFELSFSFTSDWRIGTGAGSHGALARTIVRDGDGLPCVPAKSAVGMLRDAAEIAAGALDAGSKGIWAQWVAAVFGSQARDAPAAAQPARPAALIGEPLRLPAADRAAIAAAPAESRGQLVLTRGDLLRATTLLRAAVKINPDTGTAEHDALRLEEWARAGLTVTGRWSIRHPDGGDVWPAKLLLLAAGRIVRTAGSKRRRGAGSVTVTMTGLGELDELLGRYEQTAEADIPGVWPVDRPEAITPRTARSADSLRHACDLVLSVRRPVVVDDGLHGNVVRTATFVPGSMLLPLVRDALDGATLADLVRDSAIVLTDATPQLAGRRGLPWPRALARSKDAGKDDHTYHNLTRPHRENPRLKAADRRYVTDDCGEWTQPAITMGVHAVVDDMRQRPTSETGGLFVYEGIAAGTRLRASVYLPERVHLVAGRMPEVERIGRSSKDDYGLVEIEVVAPEAPPEPPQEPREIPAGSEFTVWLTSTALTRNEFGGAGGSVDGFVATLADSLGIPGALTLAEESEESVDGDPFQVVRRASLSAIHRRQSWQRAWGLPRPTLAGLAGGSVFLLHTTKPITPSAITSVEVGGLGERTAEGFGRVLIAPPALRNETVESQPGKAQDGEPGDRIPVGAAVGRDLVQTAWRDVVVARAATAARRDRQKLLSADLSPTQRGNLRSVAAGLGLDTGRAAAGSWLDSVRRRGSEAKGWAADGLTAIEGLLVPSPDADHPIWSRLFGFVPDDLPSESSKLEVVAVQSYITELTKSAAGPGEAS